MFVPWMAWIRCVTDIPSIQQKQQISKIILDSLLDVLLVPVICSMQKNILIICIVMEVSTIASNGLDRPYLIFCGRCCPRKIIIENVSILFHTNVYCVVSCSHNICPLHIPLDVRGLYVV